MGWLKKILARRLKRVEIQPEKADRRTSERKKSFTLLRYTSEPTEKAAGETGLANSRDISEGGLCFYTNHSVENPLQVQILIHDNDEIEEIKVSGRLVWQRKIKSDDGLQDRYQVAIAFDFLDELARSVIKRLVAHSTVSNLPIA